MKLDLSNLKHKQKTLEDSQESPEREVTQHSMSHNEEILTDNPDVIDMSELKTEIVEIFQDKPEVQTKHSQNWLTQTWRGIAVWTWMLIVIVCVIIIGFIWTSAPKGDASAESLVTTEVSQTESPTTLVYNDKLSQAATASEVTKTPEELAKQDLINQASVSGLPFSVAVGQIGGNYLLGATTYYPNDPSKSYIDYTIIAPATEGAIVQSDKVKDIEKKLTSNLPYIGDIIKVKDASKVSVKTFEHSGSYTSILFYEGKPFAYTVTGDDGHSLTHVTSYYVSNVADL